MKEIVCYQWDGNLKLSDEHFERHLATPKFTDEEKPTHEELAFPSDYTLAIFSDLAYKDDPSPHLPKDWILLTTATNTKKGNGYFGSAFWNGKLRQAVVTHRGTTLSWGAFWTDIQLAVSRAETSRSYSAATFVYKIAEKLKAKMQEDGARIQLSITGHSLGAWLAQISTFSLKYFRLGKMEGQEVFLEDKNYANNLHAHTVVFESPGCKTALDVLVEKVVPYRYSTRQYGNYKTLDMTVYLSKPNFINVVHEHVGIIFVVESKTHRLKGIIELFDEETKTIVKEVVLDFPKGKYSSFKLMSPLSRKTQKRVISDPFAEDEYSLNVFNDNELDFVKDWVHVLNDSSPSVQTLKDEYQIPKFTVDYDSNIIKGEDLITTIARIKDLQPTKKMIFGRLEEDVRDRVQYEIFKIETQEYEKSLINFHNYFFKDGYHYSVNTFLRSTNHVLSIRVDEESQFKLELSILKTIVVTSHPSGGYGFLTWNKLCESLKIFPGMFTRLSLLIVEYFEVDDQDLEVVLNFLRSCTAKVIIVSMGLSYSLKETVQVEVRGLASNLTFEALTEGSQESINQIKLILPHGEKRNLMDVIRNNTLLSNDVLLEIIKNPDRELKISSQSTKSVHPASFFDRHFEMEEKICYNKGTLYVIQDKDECVLTNRLEEVFGDLNRSNIRIESKVDFEEECNDLNQSAFLFVHENDKIVLTRIFNLDFYIRRRIHHSKRVKVDTFKKLSRFSDSSQYYFCGNKARFESQLATLDEEERDRFTFILEETEARLLIKSSNSNAHLLQIDDEHIFWLYSKGSIRALRNCVEVELAESTCIDEKQLLAKDDVVIVCGGPGIGKSSMIGYLQLHLQVRCWVFTIPLKNSLFDRLPSLITLDHAVEFILKNSGVNTTYFTEHLLRNCLRHTTNLPVCLMFDAFDEISKESARKKFINLVNFLKRALTAKILITTRRYRCEELENGISVFASFFETSDSKEKAKYFLLNVWRSQLSLYESDSDSAQLEAYAVSLLDNLEHRLGKNFSDVVDVPLNIRMVAEIVPVTPGSNTTIDIPTESDIPDLQILYRKYAEIHCNIYFRRSAISEDKIVQKRWMLQSIFEGLRYLAIRRLFNLSLDAMDYLELEELNKVGLIQSKLVENNLNLGSFEFLHDSIRDYFAADCLRLWLDEFFESSHKGWDVAGFLVRDFLIGKGYKEMRRFLNCQLGNWKLDNGRLELSRRAFRRLWESDRSLFFDHEESIFHVCVNENLWELLKGFVLKVVDQSSGAELLSSRDSNLQTPLFLTLSELDSPRDVTGLSIIVHEISGWGDHHIKTVLLATFLTHHVTFPHINRLIDFSQRYPNVVKLLRQVKKCFKQVDVYLNEACTETTTNKLEELLHGPFQEDDTALYYLLKTTNDKKETGLHKCTSLKVLNRLLQLGLDLNLQDHHGMTPLTRAIKQKKNDIAKALLEKGAALTPDAFGNTPLIHAVKHENLDLVQTLLEEKHVPKNNLLECRNLTPNDLNIVHRFGLDSLAYSKKIYLKQSNFCKLTPLMFAVRNGNVTLVKFLMGHGADIKTTDCNGMTVVHHAVIKKHVKGLIKNLKDLGADINLGDRNGITPLLYSVMKGKWNKVTSLLDNGADVNIGSVEGVLPLQLLRREGKTQIIKKIIEDTHKQLTTMKSSPRKITRRRTM